SADALAPRVKFHRSISDDMVSMLYVVLYCCVRWLPHNDVEGPGRKVCRLFDQYYSDGDGSIVGGHSKNSQKVTRFFIRNILFDNVHTQSWINSLQLPCCLWLYNASGIRAYADSKAIRADLGEYLQGDTSETMLKHQSRSRCVPIDKQESRISPARTKRMLQDHPNVFNRSHLVAEPRHTANRMLSGLVKKK
ncbi:hypothetical protein DFH11DRAFT_1586657, partial [Phellopilus nigrolimitatus]